MTTDLAPYEAQQLLDVWRARVQEADRLEHLSDEFKRDEPELPAAQQGEIEAFRQLTGWLRTHAPTWRAVGNPCRLVRRAEPYAPSGPEERAHNVYATRAERTLSMLKPSDITECVAAKIYHDAFTSNRVAISAMAGQQTGYQPSQSESDSLTAKIYGAAHQRKLAELEQMYSQVNLRVNPAPPDRRLLLATTTLY